MGATPITIIERATGRAVNAELLGLLAPQDLMLMEEVCARSDPEFCARC